MKKFFRFFDMNRREQLGFFALFALICMVIFISILSKVFKKSSDIDYELISLHATDETNDDQEVNRPYERYSFKDKKKSLPSGKSELFYFDPNGLSEQDWLRMGLTEKQIKVIKNYEAKGGIFYDKEDVRKLYSISADFFSKIEPYIRIKKIKSDKSPADDYSPTVSKQFSKNDVDLVIDINRSDTGSFKKLRGIGPVYARRIVRFRESLGGFHDVAQIKEVYGITDSLYQHLSASLSVEPNPHLKKIWVNQATQAELQKHPYINFKQAELIVNYRKQHGAYRDIVDMKKIYGFNDEILRKIEPYLDFRE